MIDAHGTTDYLYDDRDQLIRVTSPEGTIHYTYDNFGRLIETRTDQSEIDYAYNGRGMLASVTTVMQFGTYLPTPEVTSYTYNEVGNLVQVTLPNGVVSDHFYDEMHNVICVRQLSEENALLDSYFYQRDNGGKITAAYNDYTQSEVEQAIAEGTADELDRIEYEYDALDRLFAERHFQEDEATPFHAIEYERDLVGNLLEMTSTLSDSTVQRKTYTHNERYQIVDEVFSIDGVDLETILYDYDANGTLISKISSDEEISYEYDLRDRLTQVTTEETESEETITTVVDYTYDHTGTRTGETIAITDTGGTTTETKLYLNDHLTPYVSFRGLKPATRLRVRIGQG